jgi:hypothetical protein
VRKPGNHLHSRDHTHVAVVDDRPASRHAARLRRPCMQDTAELKRARVTVSIPGARPKRRPDLCPQAANQAPPARPHAGRPMNSPPFQCLCRPASCPTPRAPTTSDTGLRCTVHVGLSHDSDNRARERSPGRGSPRRRGARAKKTAPHKGQPRACTTLRPDARGDLDPFLLSVLQLPAGLPACTAARARPAFHFLPEHAGNAIAS